MAEEVEMTPVEMTPVAAEPPKADPLSKPTLPGGTLKLNPIAQKPTPGAPGAALKPGLKLPPKPGATVSALKPGVKLPPKPGATVSALKPGLKLPPKPVIRKPGATASASPLPKPVVPPPRAAAPAEAAPVAPAEKPMEALKTVTQKLKGITQPIPQQAILRKTGIIADGAVTEAQKEAAKHKTARISLSDAMGVAPVKDEHAPMKTIRIKRPVNIPGSTASLTPQPKPPAAAEEDAPTMATVAPDDAAANADASTTSVTQRKTLKIARPGGTVRPAGKFGIRRPGTPAAPAAAAPAAPAEGSAPAAAPDAGVADIADIPSAIPPIPAKSAPVDTTPGWVVALSAIVQAAAVIMIGALAFFLYENTTTLYF